jgi:hypothetical protein
LRSLWCDEQLQERLAGLKIYGGEDNADGEQIEMPRAWPRDGMALLTIGGTKSRPCAIGFTNDKDSCSFPSLEKTAYSRLELNGVTDG